VCRITIFEPHRYQLGLRISLSHFQALLLGTPHPPNPALLNAVCLWGTHFSKYPQHKVLELDLLDACRQSIRGSELGFESSFCSVDMIRASCLLSLYLITKGQLLEGRHYASTAASMCIRSGLHQLGSPTITGLGGLNPFTPQVSPLSSNPLDQFDKQQVFWQCFFLDRCWSSGKGGANAFPEKTTLLARIRTPWLRNLSDMLPVSYCSFLYHTFIELVQSQIPSMDDTLGSLFIPDRDTAPLSSLSTRAAALFGRSCLLSMRWIPSTHKKVINYICLTKSSQHPSTILNGGAASRLWMPLSLEISRQPLHSTQQVLEEQTRNGICISIPLCPRLSSVLPVSASGSHSSDAFCLFVQMPWR
jgi:hypothetical protein